MVGEFHPLIHRQRQHPVHQVRHHFRGAADADLAGSELVFQARIDAFAHRAFFVALLLGPGELRGRFGRAGFGERRGFFRAAPAVDGDDGRGRRSNWGI